MEKHINQIFFKASIVVLTYMGFVPALILSMRIFNTNLEQIRYFVYSSVFVIYLAISLTYITYKYLMYKIDGLIDFNSKKGKNNFEYVLLGLGWFIYISSLILVIYLDVDSSVFIYLWFIFLCILITLYTSRKNSVWIGKHYVICSNQKISISEIKSIQCVKKQHNRKDFFTVKLKIHNGSESELYVREENVKTMIEIIKNNPEYSGI